MLTVDELEATIRQWNKAREDNQRQQWEMLRTLAAISIQPHVKKRITPRQLLPMPWDNENVKRQRTETEPMSKDDQLKRFLKRAKPS